MKINALVNCSKFPCQDVNHAGFHIPQIEIEPTKITVALISEAAPNSAKDGYYAGSDALFVQTTLLAFKDAGVAAVSIDEIIGSGAYLTTAIKCPKLGYPIQTGTIQAWIFSSGAMERTSASAGRWIPSAFSRLELRIRSGRRYAG